MKRTCAAVAIAGGMVGMVLAAGPAGADTTGAGGGGDLGGASSMPFSGSGVVELGCNLVTGVTGSAAAMVGSGVPDLPGCS